ncbi:MAG TPA: hypothetical protein VLH10_09020, partial [Yinghuangia sp.]|nr:hypothetical protein [Yinghuangia sp.]
MVTSQHEAAHRIFHERPELLTSVFRLLDVTVPERASIEVLSADVTEIRPLERRVDCVLRLRPCNGRRSFLLAIETQGRRDEDKERSWAYYQAFLQAKYREEEVLLLVLCKDQATARWASGPFAFGFGGWTALKLTPLVLG